MADAIGLKLEGGVVNLLVGGAGELGHSYIADVICKRKRRVNAVYGDFAAGNLERDVFPGTADGDGDLGAGRALHETDHAVLRELDSGYYAVVHLDYAVPLHEACFLRRAACYDLKDHGGIGRDIELDADAVEVAGQLLLRVRQLYRRQIDGMGVQRRQGSRNGLFREAFAVDGIDIILLK